MGDCEVEEGTSLRWASLCSHVCVITLKSTLEWLCLRTAFGIALQEVSHTNRAVTSLKLNNIWKMIVSESNKQPTQEIQVFISEWLLCMCPHSCAHERSMQLHTYMFLTLTHFWVFLEHFLHKLKGKNIECWRSEGRGGGRTCCEGLIARLWGADPS